MNPYVEPVQSNLFSAGDVLKKYQMPAKTRATERGELLKYFAQKMSWGIPRTARKLQGLSIIDLYYIKSAADSYEREGKGPWGKAFNGMLKPRHDMPARPASLLPTRPSSGHEVY